MDVHKIQELNQINISKKIRSVLNKTIKTTIKGKEKMEDLFIQKTKNNLVVLKKVSNLLFKKGKFIQDKKLVEITEIEKMIKFKYCIVKVKTLNLLPCYIELPKIGMSKMGNSSEMMEMKLMMKIMSFSIKIIMGKKI